MSLYFFSVNWEILFLGQTGFKYFNPSEKHDEQLTFLALLLHVKSKIPWYLISGYGKMMMNISLNWQTVLVGVCFGLLSYYVIKRLKYRLPPGPPCVPIIGNVQGQLKVNRNGKTHLTRLC